MIMLCRCLIFCQPLPMYSSGGFSFNTVNCVKLVHESDKFRFATNVPIIVCTAFQQHIQGSICSPDHVNTPQWYWEWFFLKHMESSTWFQDECDSLRSTNNRFGLQCRPLFNPRSETHQIFFADHLYALHLVQDNPVLRWIFWKPDLFQTIWLFHLRWGIRNVHRFFRHDDFLRIESPSMAFWSVLIFQLLNVCDQNVSLTDSTRLQCMS